MAQKSIALSDKPVTLSARIQDYIQLTKFRLSSLVVFSAATGYIIAEGADFQWSTLLLLMRKIEDQKELCEALFLTKAEKSFQEKLISIAKDEMTRAWTKTYSIKNQSVLRLLTEFIIAGSVGLIQDWIGNGCKESPEEIALLLEKLCESTLNGGVLK